MSFSSAAELDVDSKQTQPARGTLSSKEYVLRLQQGYGSRFGNDQSFVGQTDVSSNRCGGSDRMVVLGDDRTLAARLYRTAAEALQDVRF